MAYGLFMAAIGLCIYIYRMNITTQAIADARQDSRIDTIESLTRQVTQANLLLTQIVCQQKGTNCAGLNISINK